MAGITTIPMTTGNGTDHVPGVERLKNLLLILLDIEKLLNNGRNGVSCLKG